MLKQFRVNLFTAIAVTWFALTFGMLISDMGQEMSAYTFGWKHLVVFTILAGGYFGLGRLSAGQKDE